MGDMGPGLGMGGGPGFGLGGGEDMKDPLAGLLGEAGAGDMPPGMKELFESLANMGGQPGGGESKETSKG